MDNYLDRLWEQARAALDAATWDYLVRGAGRGIAVAENRSAWEAIHLVPRIFRTSGGATLTQTAVLGQDLSLPVMTAPNGRATRFHPQGEAELARAVAGARTIALTGSSVALWLDDLRAEVPQALLWSQIYFSTDRGFLEAELDQAAAAGCRAIVLTVDLLPNPLAPDIAPPPAAPWQRREAGTRPGPDFLAATPGDLGWLCRRSPLPVVVKGVLDPADAVVCADCGAAGVIVSNHGGNQLDTALPTALALPEVAAAVGHRIEVYVDGGIRTGEDVFKALALGARAVLVGRPASVALAAGGATALQDYLAALRSDLVRVMALCGAGSAADISPAMIRC